ncbi:MAG: Fic family protein [Ktedonobacterales bacterium]
MARYPAAADVMGLNDAILRRMRSASSTARDAKALESASMRPQMAAHYEGADLVSQAATLMADIALAHAFVDGNKRTAFAAGRVCSCR